MSPFSELLEEVLPELQPRIAKIVMVCDPISALLLVGCVGVLFGIPSFCPFRAQKGHCDLATQSRRVLIRGIMIVNEGTVCEERGPAFLGANNIFVAVVARYRPQFCLPALEHLLKAVDIAPMPKINYVFIHGRNIHLQGIVEFPHSK